MSSQLESANSNTSTAVLARSEGMSYEAMLEEHSKSLKVRGSPCLQLQSLWIIHAAAVSPHAGAVPAARPLPSARVEHSHVHGFR